MTEFPDEESCLKLLENVGCSEHIISHCQAVSILAVKIAKKAQADVDMVRAGALLHDIGRSKSHGIDHAVKGAKIAQDLGLPKSIIHIIERHIGAGLSPDDAIRFHLPKKDYRPQTLEEKIVCHADSLIGNSTRRTIEEKIEKVLLKNQKEYALKLIRLHKELSDICGIDLNHI